VRELSILKPLVRLEQVTALDPVVRSVQKVVLSLLKPRAVEDVLHGVPAGHPLHPALILLPAGSWIGAAVLDLVPGTERAARVRIVHAVANETAWTLYAASWLARRSGREGLGKALGFTAFGLVGFGGYLGGHLGYRQAVGANHAEGVLTRFPEGWHPLGALVDLPEGTPVRYDVGGEGLFVLRRGHDVHVLADVSTHLGEPLHDGVLGETKRGTATIETSHGSVFEVESGEVVHGPATAPAIRFESRTSGGLVEVRLHRP
jgi:nitrite reductase/ring-hydroxylating ferredoxin subunit